MAAIAALPAMSQAGLAISAGSAFMQFRAGQAQAAALRAQGAYARMQAKQESLKYKQNAINVLDNILATSASITARAAAGGIDPFSGTPQSLRDFALAKGAQELYTTREGEIISLAGGRMQQTTYGMQATAATQAGFAGAIGSLGSGLMMAGSIGGGTGTGGSGGQTA